MVKSDFDLTPKVMIDDLGVQEPSFTKTTNYGHFGTDDLPWERIINLH